jgi:hypothetical protein
MPVWCLLAASVAGSCASTEPAELYQRGMAEARAKTWEPAEKDLQAFVAKSCWVSKPERKCREAELMLANGFEGASRWAEAWVAIDTALLWPPHGKDEAVHGRADELLSKVIGELPTALDGGTPLLLRYRDESTDAFWVRSVVLTVDGQPVFTKDKGAQELRGEEWSRAYQGTIPPGQHVFVAETSHACKPGQGQLCSAASLRRAWSFATQPHVPLTLDVRAVVRSDGDGPARMQLEMQHH